MENVYQKPFYAQILEKRHLAHGAFILRFERKDLVFKPGQHLHVGRAETIHRREYSIYSGVDQPFLEILVKEVTNGLVSPQLQRCEVGDLLYVKGPFGGFTLPETIQNSQPFLFIATGSGVAPFHSFTQSLPHLNYRLLHGVRFENERYEHHHYPQERITACLSRENSSHFHGRVTDFLRQMPITADTLCYVCGNSDMIFEIFDLLREKELPREQIFAEIYF